MGARRPWRDLSPDLFRFTTTDLRDLHVAVMTAIEDASVLAPAMNLEHVRAAVVAQGWDEPFDDDSLQRALAQLTAWKLLEATQDHAAQYASPEEFERRDKDTERVWQGRRSKRLDEPTRRAALRKLLILDAADRLGDLRVPPGNGLEKLKGSRANTYSIRINDQRRICFRWTTAGPEDVEMVDYH